jgi:hypothetical protein
MLLLWLSVRRDEVVVGLCSMCSVPVRTPILEHRGDPGGDPRERHISSVANSTSVRKPEFSSHAFFYRVLFSRSFFNETLPPRQSLMI